MKKFYSLAAALFVSLSSVAVAQDLPAVTLDLTKPANPETFTMVDGHWDQTFSEEFPYFESQIFMFSHLVNGDSWGGVAWNGFTVCQTADRYDHVFLDETGAVKNEWVQKQWGSVAGGGVKTDEKGNIEGTAFSAKADITKPYILANMGMAGSPVEPCHVMFNDGNDRTFEGVYVTCSPWGYFGLVHGDGYARAFDQEGDKYVVTFHGMNAEMKEISKLDVVLGSFNEGVLSGLSQWKYVDLSPLGEVAGFFLTMSSTDSGDFGMNTAAYVCLDKLTTKAKSGVNTVETANEIVYNPATCEVTLANEEFVVVSNLKGQNVITTTAANVSLAGLDNGIYFVKTAKAIKRIVKK